MYMFILCVLTGHYLESVVKELEIQDDVEDYSLLDAHTFGGEEKSQQVEVHVLQSGQIDFATANKSADMESSSLQCSSGKEVCQTVVSENVVMEHSSPQDQAAVSGVEQPQVSPGTGIEDSQQSSPTATTDSPPLLVTSTPVTKPSRPAKEPPLIIRRNCTSKHHSTKDSDSPPTTTSTSLPSAPPIDTTDKTQDELSPDAKPKQVRRSSRLSLRTNNMEETEATPLRKETYNLRRKQRLSSSSTSPPSAKKRRHSDMSSRNQEGTESNNPMEWNIEEVAHFISGVPRCDYAEVFREHVSTCCLG